MKKDILLCGVGGDGIVSVAKIISDAALNMGLHLKQSEIHGMSQRGGSVFSHLRLSSDEIYSDVIPEGKVDIILSSEPMEALRYLPFLAEDGWIITNSTPFINIKNYSLGQKKRNYIFFFLLSCFAAVNLRLSDTEHIKIWSVYDEYFHISPSPFIILVAVSFLSAATSTVISQTAS